MLACVPTRTGLWLKESGETSQDVSAVIGISGRAQGTIVVSLTRESACAVLEKMIGDVETEITPAVCDAVIVCVAHRQFAAMGIDAIRALGKPTHVLFDVKGLFPRDMVDGRI